MDSKEFMEYLSKLPYATYSNACINIGYQCLAVGKGDYGTAFKLSDGRVGKIYKAYDAAYESFLDLLTTLRNPHLPVLYARESNHKFGYVVLEFLDPLTYVQYMNMSFREIAAGMSCIITGRELVKPVPSSIIDLSQGMRESAKGYCLDFREENFGDRRGTLVTLDPFTNQTKTNDHLTYVQKEHDVKRVA